MFLLAGLGNFGDKYKTTRHNFGFDVIDHVTQSYLLDKKTDKLNSEIFSGEIYGNKIIAMKPKSYMNLSGSSVQSVISFYKISIDNLIVFHDDLDLILGKVKAKIGGGNAGHNGLKDIDSRVGRNYIRVRLGIGRPENPEFEISDYVLGKFTEEEKKIVASVSHKVSDSINFLLKKNLDKFMNNINIF